VEISYSNPVYAAADGSVIDCVLILPDGRTLPFTARATDIEDHGRAIHAAIVANTETTAIAPYVAPEPPKPLPETGSPPEELA
jgi:hypothetical protein